MVDSPRLSVVQRLSGSDIIGVTEGGFDVDERRRSAEETANRPVAGVLSSLLLVFTGELVSEDCLQCFDAVGWAAGRASGL